MTAISNDVWTRDRIINLIDTNDRALAEAVINIYRRQTNAEKSSEQTVERNGVGFSALDAAFLSSIATKLPRYNMRMTPRQIEVVRPKMRRYWRQLLEIIAEKGHPVDLSAKSTDNNANSRISEIVSSNPKNEMWGIF